MIIILSLDYKNKLLCKVLLNISWSDPFLCYLTKIFLNAEKY